MVLLGAFVGGSWQELIKNSYLPLEKAESTTPLPPLALNMVSKLAYTPSCSAHKLSCMHLGLLMKEAMINPLGENTKCLKHNGHAANHCRSIHVYNTEMILPTTI
jgi:hypothetical protein